MVELMEIARH